MNIKEKSSDREKQIPNQFYLFHFHLQKIAIFDTNTCETINELKFRYGANTISFYKVDIRRKAEIESAFQEVINKFGYVDVLANVAGIADETRVEDTVQNNFVRCAYNNGSPTTSWINV